MPDLDVHGGCFLCRGAPPQVTTGIITSADARPTIYLVGVRIRHQYAFEVVRQRHNPILSPVLGGFHRLDADDGRHFRCPSAIVLNRTRRVLRARCSPAPWHAPR